MALNKIIKVVIIILLQVIFINVYGETTTKSGINSTTKSVITSNTKEEFLPQDPSKPEKTKPSKEPSTSSLFLKSFLILLLLILMFYAILKFIQKRKLKVLSNQQDSVIKVLKTVSISPNKSIQLVEIAQNIYILGIGENSISIIEKIENQTKIENIKKLCEYKNTQSSKNFIEVLGSYFGDSKTAIPKPRSKPSFGIFDQDRTILKGLKNKL